MPQIAAQSSRSYPVRNQNADHVAQLREASVRPDLAPRRTRPLRTPVPPAVPNLPAPEPMRGNDKVFLRLGNFVCTGLLTFGGELRRDDVIKMVNTKLLKMERFRQRVVTPTAGGEAWQLDPQFSAGQHVRKLTCRGGADSPELTALVDSIIEKPLDTQRPLWDMTVIRCSDGRSVLLARVHHAVADGMRLMQAVLQCDDDPTALPRARAQMNEAIAAARAGRPQQTGVLGALGSWVGSACQVGNSAWTFAQMATRRADPPTSLKDPSGVVAGWSGAMPAWPVQEIKDLAQALSADHGTINDVLLALLSGALRRLLLQRGDKVEGMSLRCLQAVNMLPVAEGNDLGNSVGSAMVPLPIAADTPRARFNACQAINRGLKASAEPAINAAILGYMGGISTERLNAMFMQVSDQATCAMSNIKGPTEKIHLCGHEVQDMRWYVSAIGNIGVFAPVISYDGQLRMCLQLDRKLNLPIADFKQALTEELAALKAAAVQP